MVRFVLHAHLWWCNMNTNAPGFKTIKWESKTGPTLQGHQEQSHSDSDLSKRAWCENNLKHNRLIIGWIPFTDPQETFKRFLQKENIEAEWAANKWCNRM